ncbi:hypothetical protein [uncultured Aquimarina sp.]|uniref:hypothetical protein n=1 Tax=uncultured Aquimarina sp. TaxID=575652 RepID=UPI00263600E1|nr:hypothetical protein [uncultured Aquimarina sp.]
MRKILKIEGIKQLNKNAQKSVLGGFITEYVSSCGPTSDGLACLTGFPHCPTGFCSGGVCSPTTNG